MQRGAVLLPNVSSAGWWKPNVRISACHVLKPKMHYPFRDRIKCTMLSISMAQLPSRKYDISTAVGSKSRSYYCLARVLYGYGFPQVVNESSTGSTTSKRVRLSLTIAVERVDFDSNSCLLRLSGRNSEENPHVKVCSPPSCGRVCVH